MVQINFAQKTVNVKIVYYGPGMSGKTTNLEVVHQRAPKENRGDLTSISTDGDRTLFFDYMPLDLGTVAGMRTCFQVYTVPGQVYYNSTRKLVLQGVDGVIFVADSAPSMVEQNLESLRNLEENLNEYGKSLATLPHVIQWNKRDLPDAMSVEELDRLMNVHKTITFEAVAYTGQGVFPTLKSLAALVLKTVMQEASESRRRPKAAPAPGLTAGTAPAAGAAPRPAAAAQPGPAGAVPAPPPSQPPAPAPSVYTPPLQVAAQLPGEAPEAPPAAPPGLQMAGERPEPQPQVSRLQTATRPVATKPVRAVSPAELMKREPARKAATTRSRSAAPTAARNAKAKAPVSTPAPKKSGVATGIFIVVAAGVGAAVAWAVLNVL